MILSHMPYRHLSRSLAVLLAMLLTSAVMAMPAWADEDSADQNSQAAQIRSTDTVPGESEDNDQDEGDGEAAQESSDEPQEPQEDQPSTDEPNPNLVNPQQLPDSSFIYDTTIAEISHADSYMNTQTVQVTGQVVGDRIYNEFDDSHCWITLQATDGSGEVVSVFMPTDWTSGIDKYGRYGVTGTTLQVRGTFYLVCNEHQGTSDIHADNVSVIARGVETVRPFKLSDFVPGIFLVLVGVGLLFFYNVLRERQR